MPQATPTDGEDSAVVFAFPAVRRKKVTAAFDGGRLTSDGGVLLLAQAEREMRICEQLAACISDRRDQSRVVHALDDILRARGRLMTTAKTTLNPAHGNDRFCLPMRSRLDDPIIITTRRMTSGDELKYRKGLATLLIRAR